MELYVIKNDEGRYYDAFSEEFTSVMEAGGVYVIYGAKQAKRIAKEANAHVVELIEKPKPIEVSEEDAEKLKAIDEGHTWGNYVVTLIEQPEKVVLTKEQAEIVERAHVKRFPAAFIYGSDEKDEELLMNAYVDGFTVAKDKKYGVWVPHVIGKMYYKDGRGSNDLDIASADCLNDKNQQFTLAEIEHYGLQDCDKVEVIDDEQ